jgi:hypothetical protein
MWNKSRTRAIINPASIPALIAASIAARIAALGAAYSEVEIISTNC